MRVAAPAERGRANEALLTLLSTTLSLPREQLSIVAGASARDKVVALEGLAPEEAERRLSSSLGRENE